MKVIKTFYVVSGLVNLMVVAYLLPSVFLAYSLVYLWHHPDDWTGPAILGPISLVLLVIVYRFGRRFEVKMDPEYKTVYRHLRLAAEILCPLGAVALMVFLIGSGL